MTLTGPIPLQFLYAETCFFCNDRPIYSSQTFFYFVKRQQLTTLIISHLYADALHIIHAKSPQPQREGRGFPLA